MNYEWDDNKNIANIAKHGIDFNIADNFEWDSAIETIDNRFRYNEKRWITLGIINKRLFVLVYVYRQDNIRIISLRKANKREINYYEKKT